MARKVSLKNVKIKAVSTPTKEPEQMTLEQVSNPAEGAKKLEAEAQPKKKGRPKKEEAAVKATPVKVKASGPKIKVTKTGAATLQFDTKKYEPGELVQAALDYASEQGIDVNNPLYQIPKRTKDLDIENMGINITSLNEMKILIRTLYNTYQPNRIAVENQQRSIEQGSCEGEIVDINNDDDPRLRFPAYAYIVETQRESEKQLIALIEKCVKNTTIGQYLTSIMGIGPLLAGALMAYIDINKCESVSQIWSYCGYNNNNDPWLKEARINSVIKQCVGDSKEITDNMIASISVLTGRKASRILKGATRVLEDGTEVLNATTLKNYLKKPPYNRAFNTVCWKLGECILKVKNNPKSKYGALLNQRILYEKTKNANHEYILEALKNMGWIDRKPNKDIPMEEQERMLKEMQEAIDTGKFSPSIGKTAQTYDKYYNGYLSDRHILERCKRWVVKLILSHVFEAMYLDAKGCIPKAPYVLSIGGHCDYISPEVPYSNFWNVNDEDFAHRAQQVIKERGHTFIEE